MRIAAVAALALVSLLAGCRSVWQQNYKSNPVLKGQTFAPCSETHIRTVEPERVIAFLQEENARRLASDVAIEDEPESETLLRTERLLRAVRLPLASEEAAVLGVSYFQYYGMLDPDNPQLRWFARHIGADYVVVTTAYAGTRQDMVTVPVTTQTDSQATVNVFGSRGASGFLQGSGHATSTTYVPTTVTRDVWDHAAIFVRKLRDGESMLSFQQTAAGKP